MKILTEYLKLTGMNQTQLAERIGIDVATLSKLISGTMEPGPKTLMRLNEATGIKVQRLVESATAN